MDTPDAARQSSKQSASSSSRKVLLPVDGRKGSRRAVQCESIINGYVLCVDHVHGQSRAWTEPCMDRAVLQRQNIAAFWKNREQSPEAQTIETTEPASVDNNITQTGHGLDDPSDADKETKVSILAGRLHSWLEYNPTDDCMTWYLDEIHQKNDYIILVHVFKTAILPLFSYGAVGNEAPRIEEWQQQFDDAQERAHGVVTPYKEILESQKISFRIITSPGSGGHEICTIANDNQVDMIVMGSRGLGMVSRTLLGSVSDYVVHNANVPVTIVPPSE